LQLKATGTFARKVCSEEALWSDITAREFQFHGFGLSSDLLKPSGWRTLSCLLRELQQTQVTIHSSACGHCEEAAAQKLICMLRSANQSTNRPKTFVGVMRFLRESLPSSLDDHRREQDAHNPATPPSGIGDAFSLHLALQDNPSGVARSSVSENPAELTLHFGWQSNHLQVAVRNDGSPPGALELEAWDQFDYAMLRPKDNHFGHHSMQFSNDSAIPKCSRDCEWALDKVHHWAVRHESKRYSGSY